MELPTNGALAEGRSELMAGPPEPRICIATGPPAQVRPDALYGIERKASREMTADRSMNPPSQNVKDESLMPPTAPVPPVATIVIADVPLQLLEKLH
jgi:hypothetical protein